MKYKSPLPLSVFFVGAGLACLHSHTALTHQKAKVTHDLITHISCDPLLLFPLRLQNWRHIFRPLIAGTNRRSLWRFGFSPWPSCVGLISQPFVSPPLYQRRVICSGAHCSLSHFPPAPVAPLFSQRASPEPTETCLCLNHVHPAPSSLCCTQKRQTSATNFKYHHNHHNITYISVLKAF